VTGDRLRLSAPRGVLTAAEVEELRLAKASLVEVLRQESSPRASEGDTEDNYTAWTRGEWDEFERLAADLEDAGRPPDEAVALARQRVREARARAGAPASELADAPVVAAREQIGAVLLRSPKYGAVWVALKGSLLAELRAEEQERPDPRPVLTTDQVLRLRGKSEAAIRAVLNALAVFPEAEIRA